MSQLRNASKVDSHAAFVYHKANILVKTTCEILITSETINRHEVFKIWVSTFKVCGAQFEMNGFHTQICDVYKLTCSFIVGLKFEFRLTEPVNQNLVLFA